MPYFIKKTDQGWDTVDKAGKVLGSHVSKTDAIKQMVAVSLNEKIAPGGELKSRAVADGSYSPPVTVQDAAKRALKWIADGKAGSGFTPVGRARAVQLASGKDVSAQTVNRMISYFARHNVDKKATGFNAGEDGFPSAGRVAWDSWGGDAGQTWVNGLSEKKGSIEMTESRGIVDAIGLVDLESLIVDGKTNELLYKWIDTAKKGLWVISGRPETDRADIIAELNRLTIEYQELILSDQSISSGPMFKAATAENLLEEGYDIEYAIDSDSAARHAYTEAGIQHVYDPTDLPGVNNMKRDMPLTEDMPYASMAEPASASPELEEVEPIAEEATEPTKEYLAEELKDLLGNLVSAKFLAHGAHWNVKGVLFSQFHKFFQKIYEDYDAAIDPTAENIRKLDFDAPFTLPEFVSDTDIDATFIGGDPVQLSLAIYKANEMLLEDVVELQECAEELNQQGIYNFLADLQDRFSLWHWQLGAVIGDDLRNAFAVDVEEVGEVHNPPQATDEMDEAPMPEADSMDQKGRSTHATIERRTFFAPIEIRAEGNGMTFTGYAALFNSPSEPLPFTETIAPGAFKRSLGSRNEVKLLWNHDSGTVLGSLRAGTLQLSEDDKGLKVMATLPDTQAGRDAAVLLKRGDVSAMSFGFRIPAGGDSWSADGNERTLKSVRLHEVSIVAFPAYPATDGQTNVRSSDSLTKKIARLAELRGVSAEEFTDALLALESGDELTERQGELLTDTLGKVLKQDPAVNNAQDLLTIKQKQLDLLLKRV